MSLACTFWYWVPCAGSKTYSSKGLQITRTGCGCLWRWNCKYQLTSNSDKLNLLFVAEWDGISPFPGCHTVCGGKNTEDHFKNISMLTRCINTTLFKDEKFMLFYVDSLSHLKTSPTTFTSKDQKIMLGQSFFQDTT